VWGGTGEGGEEGKSDKKDGSGEVEVGADKE
jgi:hypothetical protein